LGCGGRAISRLGGKKDRWGGARSRIGNSDGISNLRKTKFTKSKMKKQNNLIHVKIEYDEALESKKDLLSSKMNLIKILRAVKKYNKLRARELKLKNKLKRRTTLTLTNIRKFQKTVPKIKIHKISKKEDKDEFSEIIKPRESKKDMTLELELEQIQEKLRELQK